MSEAQKRLNWVRRLTTQQPSQEDQRYVDELVALQLRKLLELIAFGTLCANKQKYSEVYENFRSHWRAGKLLTNLERVHPDFYPTPLAGYEQNETTGLLKLISRTEGFLTRGDFEPLYDRCSALIHTRNPFTEEHETTAGTFRALSSTSVERIDALLRAHTMRLAGGQERWIVLIKSDGTVGAHICIPPPTSPVSDVSQ
jgi:hypothetical protein